MEPIIPALRGVAFDDPAWLFEPKYDGFRGILYVTPSSCTFHSKRGLAFDRFTGFCDEVRDQLRVREAILDGEVLAPNPDGQVDFQLLMRGGVALFEAAQRLDLEGIVAKRKADPYGPG